MTQCHPLFQVSVRIEISLFKWIKLIEGPFVHSFVIIKFPMPAWAVASCNYGNKQGMDSEVRLQEKLSPNVIDPPHNFHNLFK